MTTITLAGNSHCKKCLKPMDAHRSVGGDAIPNAGDVTICAYCAQISVFDEDLNLREIAEQEKEEIQKYRPLEWRMIKSIEKLILMKIKTGIE